MLREQPPPSPHKTIPSRWRVRRASGAVLAFACLLLAIPLSHARSQSPGTKADATPSASSAAQNSPPPAATTTPSNQTNIRVRVEVVSVPVTVLDKRGVPVIDLTKDEFEIFEDGKRQSIRYFGKEPPLPLRIGLIMDTSNSARRQLSFEQDAASEFVFNMLRGRSSKNQIFLQTFDATSSIIQDLTNDPELLNDKIRGLKAGGGKAFYDALYFACKEKMVKAGPRENVRRILVILSDGRDIQSTHTLDEALSMAHKAETMIYTIGIAAYGYTNPGDKILKDLADETGGAAHFPLGATPGTDLGTGYLSHGQIGDTSQNKGLGAETGVFSAQRFVHLADSLEAISRELNEQYTIGYAPANNLLDGTFRTIKVVALRKGVQVRAKPGYFATPE